MDSGMSVRKIIEGIPAHPIGCESSDFVACFTSLYLAMSKIAADEHSKYYSRFAVVAGINSLTGDNSLIDYSADDCIKALGLGDYLDFSMRYVGLSYQDIKGSTDENILFEQIVSSIRKDIPVLLETPKGWCIITGFDSSNSLYGHDGVKGNKAAILQVDEHLENDLFASAKWYEQTERVIIVGGKTPPTIHDKDVFARMSGIIDKMQTGKYDEALVSNLENDGYFNSLSREEVQHLYKLTTSYVHHHAGTRAELCWGFDVDNLHFSQETERQRIVMRCICGLFGFTHDLCWNIFRSLGDENFGARDEDIVDFMSPDKRKRIAHWMELIAFNEYKVSVYLKLLADLPVSFLDKYLNEAMFTVPFAEVEATPQGIDEYDTGFVALPERRIKGKRIPISEAVELEADSVYLLDMHEEQGMFYYSKSAICGNYTDEDGDDVCMIPLGRYLRVIGILPIAIYNICDSWYGHHGITFDWTRRMVIERSKDGQVTTYLPIDECTGVEGPL